MNELSCSIITSIRWISNPNHSARRGFRTFRTDALLSLMSVCHPMCVLRLGYWCTWKPGKWNLSFRCTDSCKPRSFNQFRNSNLVYQASSCVERKITKSSTCRTTQRSPHVWVRPPPHWNALLTKGETDRLGSRKAIFDSDY